MGFISPWKKQKTIVLLLGEQSNISVADMKFGV